MFDQLYIIWSFVLCQVFAGVFPSDSTDFIAMRIAIEKLTLNDRSVDMKIDVRWVSMLFPSLPFLLFHIFPCQFKEDPKKCLWDQIMKCKIYLLLYPHIQLVIKPYSNQNQITERHEVLVENRKKGRSAKRLIDGQIIPVFWLFCYLLICNLNSIISVIFSTIPLFLLTFATGLDWLPTVLSYLIAKLNTINCKFC